MSKRIKFFLGHLAVSVVIALLVLSVVFFVWYPAPLAKAVGVTHIFLMLIAIDVIMGPMLSLLVYKEGKKTLKFDLTVIILLQLSALGYGLHSIADGRPVWIVYSVDRFDLVKNNEIYPKHLDQAQAKYQQPSWFAPQYAAAQFAQENKQRQQDMFDEILGGVDISQRPERYVELSKATAQIQQRAQDLKTLNQFNDPKQVADILAKYPQATAFVPLKATAVDMTVLINKEKSTVVDVDDLRPWK